MKKSLNTFFLCENFGYFVGFWIKFDFRKLFLTNIKKKFQSNI